MNIQSRAKKILTTPGTEWRVIAQEPADVGGLMRAYAAPLAAVPAVCQFIGLGLVGMALPFLGTIRVGIGRGLATSVVSWVMALVGVFLAGVVVDRLAPIFKSQSTQSQALKLVVHSYTPVWLAGILYLVPALAVLILLAALYAVYLFYLGLPVLLKTPSDQVIPYMAVSALAILVVSIVLGAGAAVITGGPTGFRMF